MLGWATCLKNQKMIHGMYFKKKKKLATSWTQDSSTPGRVYQFSKLPYSARPGLLSFEGQIHHSPDQSARTERKTMTAKMGWLRHVLTMLSVVIFVSY